MVICYSSNRKLIQFLCWQICRWSWLEFKRPLMTYLLTLLGNVAWVAQLVVCLGKSLNKLTLKAPDERR